MLMEAHRAPTWGGLVGRFDRVHPSLRVMLFATGLLALGSGFLMLTPSATVEPARAWHVPFLGLALAFGLAEASALHVEIRKESHSLSLSGIPLMFGLIYASPVMLAFAYLLGSAPTMLWIRKSDLVKTTWNCSLFFTEAALAALLVRSVLGQAVPGNVLEWLVVLCAVLAAEMLSLFAVPLVIMTVDAKFRANLFRDVGRSQVLAALAGAFTVTIVASSLIDPYLVLFSLVPLIGLGALLRSTGGLAQRFRDLEQLHGFTRTLTNERGTRTVDAGLAHLVELMRSRTALLVVVGQGDEPSSARALVDDAFVDLDPDPIVNLLLDSVSHETAVQLTVDDPRPTVRELLERLGMSGLLAARMLGEVERRGVLLVGDRLGMRHDFNIDELRLFGSLAGTLSARLANDYLVERLEVQAQHDALTGLPNRLSFEIAVTASLAASGHAGAVVMIDLDRFKEVNDSLGHETGDRLLIEVARRLRNATRGTDMVARFGGDEFAMLMTCRPGEGPVDLSQRVQDIHRRLTDRFRIDDLSFEIGASLGVAQWPTQGADSESLLRRADTAMYQAKRNQLGVVFYTPELDADAPRRMDLYLSCRAALERDELYIHLQPKVALDDGRITGAEALVRWIHPAHGPISPAEFVPLLAQAGLIGKLTRFVVRRAAETAAVLRDMGHPIPIAVNLTPRDLLDPALPDDILGILAEARVDASAIQIEITEDAMVVDFDASVTVITRLRALGMIVAIDDFGTGYSSLQHLHRLPIDQLKIDRSFISRLADDSSAAAIVRASINLARDLGIDTVAEGVEDQLTLDMITALGCTEAQGYYFSRPIPTAELLDWLHALAGCGSRSLARPLDPSMCVDARGRPSSGSTRGTHTRRHLAVELIANSCIHGSGSDDRSRGG